MTDPDALRLSLQRRLGDWGFSPAAVLRLLDISENTTFLAEEAERRLVLRVYRPSHHQPAEIASELAWIGALRTAAVIATPAPVPATDGSVLRTIGHGVAARLVAAFDWVPGHAPEPASLVGAFRQLGTITARLHRQARGWRPPAGFTRKRWTVETTLGPEGHWGDWRAACGLDAAGAALLARAETVIARTMARYGVGADRFGLIHGDLRLTNLLVAQDRMTVIDFDDCGFGWFLYDFAASVSFFEDDPVVPSLAAAWAEGYRRVGRITAEDEAVLPALILMRRMLLLAWVASHQEAPTAQAMGRAYTRGALGLAEDFLSTHS